LGRRRKIRCQRPSHIHSGKLARDFPPHQCERLALQTEVPEGTRTFARVALDDATVGAASVAFRATFARPLCPRVAPAFARRVELATILTHVHISA